MSPWHRSCFSPWNDLRHPKSFPERFSPPYLSPSCSPFLSLGLDWVLGQRCCLGEIANLNSAVTSSCCSKLSLCRAQNWLTQTHKHTGLRQLCLAAQKCKTHDFVYIYPDAIHVRPLFPPSKTQTSNQGACRCMHWEDIGYIRSSMHLHQPSNKMKE